MPRVITSLWGFWPWWAVGMWVVRACMNDIPTVTRSQPTFLSRWRKQFPASNAFALGLLVYKIELLLLWSFTCQVLQLLCLLHWRSRVIWRCLWGSCTGGISKVVVSEALYQEQSFLKLFFFFNLKVSLPATGLQSDSLVYHTIIGGASLHGKLSLYN